MHVGVFPNSCRHCTVHRRLPHARGGVSIEYTDAEIAVRSSPCTWGCFLLQNLDKMTGGVFPMHVGVFPFPISDYNCYWSLPHARGGVSGGILFHGEKLGSSPCTWGCFSWHQSEHQAGGVFPMHVGVFPSLSSVKFRYTCLPHARGGVSSRSGSRSDGKGSSPCTWGCF